MPAPAAYDVLSAYQNIHQIVLKQAEALDDAQLRWKPENYSTSIGFHLCHLAREADYLKAAILEHYPALGPDFGAATQIWHAEKLAEKWGLKTSRARCVCLLPVVTPRSAGGSSV